MHPTGLGTTDISFTPSKIENTSKGATSISGTQVEEYTNFSPADNIILE
jgi:hypothetical protein